MRAAHKRAVREIALAVRKIAGAVLPAFFSTYFLAAICHVEGRAVFALACGFAVAAYFYQEARGVAWSGTLVGAALAVALLLGFWSDNEALMFSLGRYWP